MSAFYLLQSQGYFYCSRRAELITSPLSHVGPGDDVTFKFGTKTMTGNVLFESDKEEEILDEIKRLKTEKKSIKRESSFDGSRKRKAAIKADKVLSSGSGSRKSLDSKKEDTLKTSLKRKKNREKAVEATETLLMKEEKDTEGSGDSIDEDNDDTSASDASSIEMASSEHLNKCNLKDAEIIKLMGHESDANSETDSLGKGHVQRSFRVLSDSDEDSESQSTENIQLQEEEKSTKPHKEEEGDDGKNSKKNKKLDKEENGDDGKDSKTNKKLDKKENGDDGKDSKKNKKLDKEENGGDGKDSKKRKKRDKKERDDDGEESKKRKKIDKKDDGEDSKKRKKSDKEERREDGKDSKNLESKTEGKEQCSKKQDEKNKKNKESDSEDDQKSKSKPEKEEKDAKKSKVKKSKKKAGKRNETIYDGVNYKFDKNSPGVTQLNSKYQVYVLQSDYDSISSAQSAKSFVTKMIERVYTKEALKASTPRGFPPRGKGRETYKNSASSPMLHPDGLAAIIAQAITLQETTKSWRPKRTEGELMGASRVKCSTLKRKYLDESSSDSSSSSSTDSSSSSDDE